MICCLIKDKFRIGNRKLYRLVMLKLNDCFVNGLKLICHKKKCRPAAIMKSAHGRSNVNILRSTNYFLSPEIQISDFWTQII